uniref:LysR substrate-binding domain-containing protein n=1 Tax=Marinobacter sp. TaxID=50741 RepID=UPI003A95097B
HDVINEDVIDMVQIGQVELGIGFKPYPASLAFEPLFNDQFVAIVPPGTLSEREDRVEWEALLEHPFISLQKPSAVQAYLEDSLRDRNLVLKTELEAHQLSTVGKMVATGLGVSVVPALCAPQMKALGAKILKLQDFPIEKPVGLIWHREREQSAATRALYDVLRASRPDSALTEAFEPPTLR